MIYGFISTFFNTFISVPHPQRTSLYLSPWQGSRRGGKNLRMEAKAVETPKRLKFGSVGIASGLVQTV